MFHLIYVSSAVNLFSEDELTQLLEISRVNNATIGITGMLLYLEGNFIQVLEGEKEAVLNTQSRISKDPRHRGILTLLQGDIEKREFAEWSMGFRNLDPKEGQELPGYTDFLSRKGDPKEQRTPALRLLEHFKTINR